MIRILLYYFDSEKYVCILGHAQTMGFQDFVAAIYTKQQAKTRRNYKDNIVRWDRILIK
jgi:hypothetical protein